MLTRFPVIAWCSFSVIIPIGAVFGRRGGMHFKEMILHSCRVCNGTQPLLRSFCPFSQLSFLLDLSPKCSQLINVRIHSLGRIMHHDISSLEVGPTFDGVVVK